MTARRPVVWLAQDTMRKVNDRLVPAHDTSKAERFGERRTIVGPSIKPFNPNAAREDLALARHAYEPRDDYLLLIGSPIFCGMALAVFADKADFMEVPSIRLLLWRPRDQDYEPITMRADSIFGFET